MENTHKLLFDDNKPEWYIALGEKSVGPMTAADVYKKIIGQEVTWAHHVWKPGMKEWQRICDTQAFASAVPPPPPQGFPGGDRRAPAGPLPAHPTVRQAAGGRRGVAQGVQPPAAPRREGKVVPAVEKRTWFLHYNDSQFGPFSEAEVRRFLSIGKIHGRVFAWEDGMPSWERLEKLGRFDAEIAEGKKARPELDRPKKKKEDKRRTPRRPILAKIIMANSDSVIVGMCRDISIGGMQVLTDQIPGVSGSKIKLNVSPAGEEKKGKNSPKIEPFVAEGVIVRILEDGRGFSFRFDRLAENARKAIEHFIASTG